MRQNVAHAFLRAVSPSVATSLGTGIPGGPGLPTLCSAGSNTQAKSPARVPPRQAESLRYALPLTRRLRRQLLGQFAFRRRCVEVRGSVTLTGFSRPSFSAAARDRQHLCGLDVRELTISAGFVRLIKVTVPQRSQDKMPGTAIATKHLGKCFIPKM